jgi:oligopeptide transport system permease protein
MAVLGLIIILVFILLAIFADTLAPRDYRSQSLVSNNSAPQWIIDMFPVMKSKEDGGYVTESSEYILGADDLGRDILSRIIYGTRISLAVAFIGPIVAMAIGLTMGMMSGFFGGRIDNIIMRVVDIFYAFPTLLLIILMMAYFRGAFNEASQSGTLGYTLYLADRSMGGMLFIFIGIGLTSWVGLARLTRAEVLSAREREYVLAARSLGANRRTIMIRHLLPNILGPLIVAETLTIPVYIRYEAFLSFIGLGVNRPTPSWGSMIADGSKSIASYPYQALFPAIALFLIMFAFNFLGDGLRDALDPRMRGTN